MKTKATKIISSVMAFAIAFTTVFNINGLYQQPGSKAKANEPEVYHDARRFKIQSFW